MDVYERRVLRRKRPIIADTMGFSIEDQKYYMKEGILDESMMGEIMVEVTEFGQMLKFLELITTTSSDALNVLYGLMESRDMGWMAEEVRTEIAVERGELEVEEYVYREAGMLVHRQFGDTTRIAEADKKEIQLLMALRYQTGKEAWQSHVSKSNRELEDAIQWKTEECTRMKVLVDKVATFLRVQQKHVNEISHDMHTPPELLKMEQVTEEEEETINPAIDYLSTIEKTADHLLEVLARIIFERESLNEERKRCMEILQIDKPKAQLDTMLNFALLNASQDATHAKREADLSDKLAQSLDARMKNQRLQTDRDLAAKERYISQLSSQLKDKSLQIQNLEKQSKEFQHKWEDEKEESLKWKKRCDILEKTRRLGYYTPGWYDKLYEIDGIEYSRMTGETPPPLIPHGGNNNTSNNNNRFIYKLKKATSEKSLSQTGSSSRRSSVSSRGSFRPAATSYTCQKHGTNSTHKYGSNVSLNGNNHHTAHRRALTPLNLNCNSRSQSPSFSRSFNSARTPRKVVIKKTIFGKNAKATRKDSIESAEIKEKNANSAAYRSNKNC